MGSGIFFNLLTKPLYNGLIFLIDYIPDYLGVGFAVILFTVLVKLVLFPLSKKSIQTQVKMKQSEKELEAVKDKYKDNKQEQARQIMEFYKNKGINPFSGIFLIFIQIPIVYALYIIFLKGGFSNVDVANLYSFISPPSPDINMSFLWLAEDISQKSYILAFLAAASQYFQIAYSIPSIKQKEGPKTFKDDLARSMSLQMKYIFPVMVFFIAYKLSGTIAIYWITSNIFALVQEIVVRRKVLKELKISSTK